MMRLQGDSLGEYKAGLLIMMGGIQQKEGSETMEGEAEVMAGKAGEFIVDLLSS